MNGSGDYVKPGGGLWWSMYADTWPLRHISTLPEMLV